MTSFRVDHDPIEQPRHRHMIAYGKNRKQYVKIYVPGDHPVHAFKQHVRLVASQHFTAPLTGPVAVSLTCYFGRRKSHVTPKGRLRKSAPRHKTSVPDWDNVSKSICDALNGIAWVDDAQIVDGRTVKKYASEEHPVGVEIEIKPLAQGA